MGVQPVGLRHLKPPLISRHVFFSGGDIVDPGLHDAAGAFQLRIHLAPERERMGHHRQFALIAPLLADPAPVAGGLLPRHAALFAKKD